MGSVQFVGRHNVVDAFKSRNITTWGLFEKKVFLCGGENADALEAFLKKLEPSGTAAVYTLRVYKNIEDPDELTDKMECNGSFNFRLTNAAIGGSESGAGGYAGIMAKLDELEQRINGDDDDDDDENSISGIVLGWLREPQKLATVVGAFKSLATPGPMMPVSEPAMVGAFETKNKGSQMSDEEKIQRLSVALDRLEKKDPDIIVHLEKLADLAEKNPQLFNLLIAQLNGL